MTILESAKPPSRFQPWLRLMPLLQLGMTVSDCGLLFDLGLEVYGYGERAIGWCFNLTPRANILSWFPRRFFAFAFDLVVWSLMLVSIDSGLPRVSRMVPDYLKVECERGCIIVELSGMSRFSCYGVFWWINYVIFSRISTFSKI